ESREASGGARLGVGVDQGNALVKVLALDYGSARTGVAVSDATGTIARPLCVVERAATPDGLKRLAALIDAEGAERGVVGMPLTMRGERGEQALETERFVDELRRSTTPPLRIVFPEGFTRKDMARRIAAVDRIARRKRHVRPKLSASAYLRVTGKLPLPRGFGRPRSPEGFLFPATYDFLAGTTSRQLA